MNLVEKYMGPKRGKETKAKNFKPIFRTLTDAEKEDFISRERNNEFVMVKALKVPPNKDTMFTKGKTYKVHFQMVGSFFTSAMGGYIKVDAGYTSLFNFSDLEKYFKFI